MNELNAVDETKYNYALLARDIRRLAALIHRTDIHGPAREPIDHALEKLESRTWLISFVNPASGALVHDQDVYSDGRPVTTAIDWGGGFATLVHCPDPRDETSGDAEELAEELWPDTPWPPPRNSDN